MAARRMTAGSDETSGTQVTSMGEIESASHSESGHICVSRRRQNAAAADVIRSNMQLLYDVLRLAG
jgi:hypothetical protein